MNFHFLHIALFVSFLFLMPPPHTMAASTNEVLGVSTNVQNDLSSIFKGSDKDRELDPMGSFFRVLISLVVVICIFLGGVWLFKNRISVSNHGGISGKLKVLESKFIGNRQGLVVVAYGKKRMLLGTSSTGITALGDLPDLTEDEQATLNSNSSVQNSTGDGSLSFSSILAKASKNQKKGHKDVDSSSSI